ncbi:hypothetical protein [Streptomyces aureus]|uniref:hypothetical protein n=1 Tax=Streptomyces aureus TaxID=193461 RepID=UPI0006E2990D|nr:hypothetical protein [Streptomyces aureus]
MARLTLYDLRHGGACRAATCSGRERPHPRAIRRTVVFHRWPRFNRDAGVARAAAHEERRARQRLRLRVGRVLSVVNAPDGTIDLDAADTVDIPPARHRHSELWFA